MPESSVICVPRINTTPVQARDIRATPVQARDIRARAWAFVFECHARKENAAGVTSTNGDDAKGSVNDRAKASIPKF